MHNCTRHKLEFLDKNISLCVKQHWISQLLVISVLIKCSIFLHIFMTEISDMRYEYLQPIYSLVWEEICQLLKQATLFLTRLIYNDVKTISCYNKIRLFCWYKLIFFFIFASICFGSFLKKIVKKIFWRKKNLQKKIWVEFCFGPKKIW